MLKYEWKKLLFNRKGIWLILFLLAAELLGTLFLTQPYDRELEANREVYESYLSQVEGPLTQENREALEAEMERLGNAEMQMSQLKRDYYDGKVTEEEYRTQFDDLLEDTEKYAGFSKLYTQYIYVREAENRSFLYTGGWEVLLTDQEPDYLFLLVLIVLLTPIFCEEYASGMHHILLTQKKSARYMVLTKVGVALILTAALTAVLQLMDLCYCAVIYGLPHWDYSLQSLHSFGGAAKELTLGQAFWLHFALKELGYLYCAVLILLLSVVLKKFALTLMASIAMLPLPFLTVDSNAAFLKLPGPWALTLGSIYLNGSKTSIDSATGETLYLTKELTMAELGVFTAVVVVILALMLCIIHRRNINQHTKFGRKRVALALCTAMLVLTGCGTGEETENVCYNSSASYWCETEDYVIVGGFLESYMIDKETGEITAFPLDAATGQTVSSGTYFFARDDSIYYLKTTTLNPHAGWDSISKFPVLAELDTQTLDESVAYQWNRDTDWFFGLLDRVNTEANPTMVGTLFIHGNYLYYNDQSGAGLCRMNMTTGNYETVDIDQNSQNLAYDGENIYYADSYNRLTIHDLNIGEITALDDVIVSDFLLTPEGIYFLNRRDNDTLYYWDSENGSVIKLDDTSASAIYWDESYLWIKDANGTLHRMDHDGKNRTVFTVEGLAFCQICIPRSGDTWYALDTVNGVFYTINKHTLEYSSIEF